MIPIRMRVSEWMDAKYPTGVLYKVMEGVALVDGKFMMLFLLSVYFLCPCLDERAFVAFMYTLIRSPFTSAFAS